MKKKKKIFLHFLIVYDYLMNYPSFFFQMTPQRCQKWPPKFKILLTKCKFWGWRGGPKNEDENIDEPDEYFAETTTVDEVCDFEKWAKNQANKQLECVKQYTNLQDTLSLRKTISDLNSQQSKVFHDIIEREICRDQEKEP